MSWRRWPSVSGDLVKLARCCHCEAHAGIATLEKHGERHWRCFNRSACSVRQTALIYDLGLFYLRDDEMLLYPGETK